MSDWNALLLDAITPLDEELPFLSPEAQAELDRQGEEEKQEKFDDYERRRQAAQEKIRREREQAEIDGHLSGDAEAFRDLRLRPRLQEIHTFEQRVRTPIVQGLLFKDTLAWVAGSSGTFKSFITADLAFRYGAEDMDYHGKRMTSGRALLIIAEGAGGYADRRAAWEKEHDREVKNVTIYPDALQLFDIQKEMPALLSVLKEEAEAGKPFDLIIFDTQAMCTVGVDENASEMNRVIRTLHTIREASGACVLVVHHFGKDGGKGMRGSSMIYAAADTVIVVNREDKESMDVSLSTGGEHGKQKDAPTENNLLTLNLRPHEVGEDYFGDPTTSLVAVEADTRSRNVADEAPAELPEVAPVDMYYLRGIGTYDGDGASPAALKERLPDPDYADRVGPRPPHKAIAQTYSNRLQGLKRKGLTEPVPGSKGKWRITPLGSLVVSEHLIALMHAEQALLDRNARRGQFRGPNTSGLDHDQTLG